MTVGDVELGYAYEAKRFSDQTHHLPPPPRALGDQDSFVKAYEQFKNALDSDASGAFDNDKPIVFTMCEDHTTDQIDMLKQFWSTFNAQRMPEVDVFPMKRLYFAMKNKLAAMGQAQELKTEGLVNILLGNDPYELKSKISCEVSKVSQFCGFISLMLISFSTNSSTKKTIQPRTAH